MIDKKLKNRPFFSEFESPITEKNHIYYKVASKVFEKNGLDKDIESVTPLKTCFDYDSFLVNCKTGDYILKISLDDKNKALLSESLFYKNNKDVTLCHLVDSGVMKVGDNISFLLVKHDLGFDLFDLGASYILDNSGGFFVTFINQKKFVANQTVEDYVEQMINELSFENLSEASKSNIKVYQDLEVLYKIFHEIKSNLIELKSKDIFRSCDFCHGNLDFDSLTSLDGLFKFCNYENSFYGNQFIDLSIMCLNLGYQERDFNRICRQYCKILGLDYESKKGEIRECLNFSYIIHLCRLVYNFIIEQCIYKNSREDRITHLVRNFFDTYWCLKKSEVALWTKDYLENIFNVPIDFDLELKEKYSD